MHELLLQYESLLGPFHLDCQLPDPKRRCCAFLRFQLRLASRYLTSSYVRTIASVSICYHVSQCIPIGEGREEREGLTVVGLGLGNAILSLFLDFAKLEYGSRYIYAPPVLIDADGLSVLETQ